MLVLGDDLFAPLLTFANVITPAAIFLHASSLLNIAAATSGQHHELPEQSAAREIGTLIQMRPSSRSL
jgi:hypothetical protein